MRVIKFRAWDTTEGVMRLDVQDTYDCMQGICEDCFGDILEYPEIYEVMQYIGLHDRNGKEIYEGDIVTVRHPFKGRAYTGQIIFEKGAFIADKFYFSHHDNPVDIWESIEYVEVVGNIYENPELMGG